MKFLIGAMTLMIAGSTAAFAYEPGHGAFEDWQTRQMQRIEEGRRSGAITWSEGNGLRAEQRAILARRQELLADGYLSRSDRRNLADMLEAADRNIDLRADDSRRRAWFMPRFGR